MNRETEHSSDLLSSPRIPDDRRKTLQAILENFNDIKIPLEEKLANFPNWVTTRDLVRFMVRYEIFKKVLDVPGAIFECGVHWGGGVSSWIHLSEIFEPVAFTRRIHGFDTFSGFRDIGAEDRLRNTSQQHNVGDFNVGSQANAVIDVLKLQDRTRKVTVDDRLNIVVGDISQTLPELLEENPGFTVALLYLDVDLFEPTKNSLRAALPRMSRDAIVVFDQLNDSTWPGETQALLEVMDLNEVRLRTFPWAPRISYFRVGDS